MIKGKADITDDEWKSLHVPFKKKISIIWRGMLSLMFWLFNQPTLTIVSAYTMLHLNNTAVQCATYLILILRSFAIKLVLELSYY